MERKWDKIDETHYAFSVDQQGIGTLQFFPDSTGGKALVQMGEQSYQIKRTGFWKNALELTDPEGQCILKVYAEKWYANSYVFYYQQEKYKLKIRNNPLSEWVILKGEKEWIAYGLHAEGQGEKILSKITSAPENQTFLFDFLLWYLFVPIAAESMGDQLTFLLLLTAQ
jgi:hypothetical protein